jgi:hypothetical protein
MAGIDIKTIQSALPDSLKQKGIAKVKDLIMDKGQEVKNKLQPALDNIVSQLPDPNSVCLNETQTQKILDTRNNIVGELNRIQNVLNVLSTSIGLSSGFLEAVIITATTIRALRTSLSAATTALGPLPVPGVLLSSINTANEILDRLKYDNLGNPKLEKLRTNIDATSIPIALTAVSLSNFINTLNIIDVFLVKCAPTSNLEKVNEDTLKTVTVQNIIDNSSQSNNSLYQGFNIEIEEKDYTPTVKQRRAVGKNNQEIILISTPYSFTTNDQVLIDELKFIISRDNLKAY